MTRRAASILFGVAVLCVGVFIAYYASLAKGSSRYDLGPSFFPKVVGIGLALLGLYTIIDEYCRGERVAANLINGKFLLGLAGMAVYTALLLPLGYVASGIFINVVLMVLLCDKPLARVWPYLAVTGLLAPLAIYLIFAKYLLVPLPALSL